ncbi:MAG: S8 family serine peptidase [Gammaproteobacteria bacterium]
MRRRIYRLGLILFACGIVAPCHSQDRMPAQSTVQIPVQTRTAQNDRPPLIAMGSDTCLLSGQRLRLRGEHLGSERTYQLVLHAGSRQWPLRVEEWREQAIVALLPELALPVESPAVLLLKNRQSAAVVSNRLPVAFCAAPASRSRPVERTQRAEVATEAPVEPAAVPGPPAPRAVPTGPAVNRVFVADSPARVSVAVSDDAETGDATAEPGEVIVFSRDMTAARALDAQLRPWGYHIKRRRALQQLGLVINVIRLPDTVTVAKAVQTLEQLEPPLLVDANHQYHLMQADASTAHRDRSGAAAAQRLVGWDRPGPACGRGLRIGLVDTLVDVNHASLSRAKIVARSFLPLGVTAAEGRHGTAIASLLVASADGVDGVAGLLPAAELYSAGVFRERARQRVDTTAELIITALDWLQGQRVDVINLSLAGKANRLLQSAIEQLIKQDQLIAAAAGNAGATAPPAYPAAWPGVAAVTAVDLRRDIYRQANQGRYLDLAAPGVDVWAARSGAGGAYYSGTSYAVPYVSAALAVLRQRHGGRSNAQLLTQLQRQARDLGAAGPDPVFGHGLLQLPGACGPQ